MSDPAPKRYVYVITAEPQLQKVGITNNLAKRRLRPRRRDNPPPPNPAPSYRHG